MDHNNKMDVDATVPPSPGVKRTSSIPVTSSTVKRVKFHIPPDQLSAFNDTMNDASYGNLWDRCIDEAKDDRDWRRLISNVLVGLTDALSTTDMKASVLAPLTLGVAKDLAQSFNEDELKEWREGVQKCVKSHDWADLVAYQKIRVTISPSSSGDLSGKAAETREEQARRLAQMFSQTFQGSALSDFVLALPIYDNMYNPDLHFGRSISFLQSSGTGKSRLVEELGNLLPTLNICLRASQHPRAGWPPGDEPAMTFFATNEFMGEELAAAFLGALMVIVAAKLEAGAQSFQHRQSWTKDWMQDWQLDTPTDVPNSSRHQCFTEVKNLANLSLVKHTKILASNRLQTLTTSEGTPRSAPDWHKFLFRLFCFSPAKKLVQIFRSLGQKYFAFAFDECSQLGTRVYLPGAPRHSNFGMSLIALQRIIKSCDDFDLGGFVLWFLLLDTSSSIPNLLPSGPKTGTVRLTESYIPLPPWSFLGFNQMVTKQHSASIQKASDVHSVGHLKVYGRPYWKGLENREVLKAAFEKLFCGTAFNPKDVDHVFAAFAIRIGLEIGSGEASARLAMEAVGTHMRILIGVAGQLVITASPSEPMLAVAAASALNKTTQSYKNAIETLLNELILRGLILDRGLQSELYSRLLLTLARDKAVLPHGGSFMKISDAHGHEVQPVRLSCFLQTLLGSDLGIPFNNSAQCNLRKGLLVSVHEVWINFTHFVELSESISEVTTTMLLEAWSSGYAFQCVFHQPVIDGFIVVYRGRLDAPFNPDLLFVLPYQTKARSDAAELALAHQLTAPFLAVAEHDRCKPEHVVILMDLGTCYPDGPHCNLSFGAAERPSTKGKKIERGATWDGYARDGEQEGKRHCLHVRGHRSTTSCSFGI